MNKPKFTHFNDGDEEGFIIEFPEYVNPVEFRQKCIEMAEEMNKIDEVEHAVVLKVWGEFMPAVKQLLDKTGTIDFATGKAMELERSGLVGEEEKQKLSPGLRKAVTSAGGLTNVALHALLDIIFIELATGFSVGDIDEFKKRILRTVNHSLDTTVAKALTMAEGGTENISGKHTLN